MIELAILTAAVAAGCWALGHLAGRLLDDAGAPAAIAIGRGVALVVIAAAALDAIGAWTATTSGVLGGAAAIAAGALVLRDRRRGGTPAARGSVVPAVIAVALGTLAIAAAAGDPHYATFPFHTATSVHHALVEIGGSFSAHLTDDGWAFALVLALVLPLVPRNAPLARTGIVLVLAAKPLDGHDLAPQWLVVALLLTAFGTWRRRPARRRLTATLALVTVALVLAATSASLLDAALAVALGAAIIGLVVLVGDDEAARTCEDGEPSSRGLAALAAALLIALVLCGARATIGLPATSWQSRTVHRIDVAVLFAKSR